MGISWSAWEETQNNLVQDFVDLFLPPRYTFSVETSYPKTASMEALIEDRFDSLDLPEPKLLRLGELLEESCLEDFPRKQADLFTLYAYNVLEGFGHGFASNLEGAAFEGLNQLATTWGLYLAREVERLFRKWRLFSAFADFTFDLFSVFCQIPPKELGETIRESVTPAYLRAGETVAYELALFHNDQPRMRESLGILLASDAELERQIANLFSGYSTTQVGRRMQRMLIAVVSQLRGLFSSNEFCDEFNEKLPTAVLIACRNISWYIGRRLSRNLQYDPQRTNMLLEAIGHRNEIKAAVEQYRYKYSWGGDRTKAIELSWQAVAPSFLYPSKRAKDIHKIEAQERLVARAQAQKVPYLSGRMEDIHEDEVQLRLIGLAKGLEDFTTKNPPIQALTEGLLGKLRAYLRTAAENEEIDYVRKQETEGNIALTDALHTEDLRHPDREEDEELSDDEILSREKLEFTRSRPSRKNDNAYIEQKNWTHVRKILGYLRYDTCAELSIINDLYCGDLRLYKNFFQPVMKLDTKERIGGSVKRKYDAPKTPYHRLMESGQISEETRKQLEAVYLSSNPAQLKRSIDTKLDVLYRTYEEKKKSEQINPMKKVVPYTVTSFMIQKPKVGLPT